MKARPGLLSRIVAAFRNQESNIVQIATPPKPAAWASELWWLTDVPSFIDEQSVERLYNAIVKPEYVLLQSNESYGDKRGWSESSELSANMEHSIPTFLKVGASVKVAGSQTQERTFNAQVTKQFVHSSERRLQEIVTAYCDLHEEHLLFDSSGATCLRTLNNKPLQWSQAEDMLNRPGVRPLVFIDFEPGTCILPIVGETVGGRTVLLIESIVGAMRDQGHSIPEFPEGKTKADAALRLEYWNTITNLYDNLGALKEIQQGFGNGERIEWIDFRIKTKTRPRPLLCHFSSSGRFPNGIFAINLVRRGYKEGFRLIAQLKKGCDLNVLAFYER